MDEKIRAAVAEIPAKTRSKLEPHAEIIRELRQKGRTYEEIAQFFAERFNLKVAPSTIHAFVRVRARRQRRLRIELPAPTALDGLRGKLVEDDVKRIEELKRRRITLKEAERPQFQYDENEPLELVKKTTKDR